MALIGSITIPAPVTSSTPFPFVPDYPFAMALEPGVFIQRFGDIDGKIEQRFKAGDGQVRYQFRKAVMTRADRAALSTFWYTAAGALTEFPFSRPNPNGTITTVTCRFADTKLTFESLAASISGAGITLVEVPSAPAPYPIATTVLRGPISGGLASALLDQVQTLIPLLTIQPLQTAYPAITLSDRLCTVGTVTYQPRLVNWDGIQQSIGGSADQAQFTLGNADRVFSLLANSVDLRKADVQFCLFHVETSSLIKLWRGNLTRYRITAGAEFPITCVDGIYELTLPYPTRRISRTCQKVFDSAESGCPWTSASGTGDPTACDKGLATANGCTSHAMDRYFGGCVASPQTVDIFDNSTGTAGYGRDRINSTSQVSDTVYDQVIPEIYCAWVVQDGSASPDVYANDPNDALKGFPVSAKVIEGRKESEFYVALGIVGEGPVAFPSVRKNTAEGSNDGSNYFLDNQPPHGITSNKSSDIIQRSGGPWGAFGLRRGNGSDPAINNDPDGGSDQFNLSQGGSGAQSFSGIMAAGTAFCEIRRSDTPGVQPTTIESHNMRVPVRYGLPGWVWSGGSRILLSGLGNPVWIALNAYLKGRGVWHADQATQETYFNVAKVSEAAGIAYIVLTKLLGTGTATQFRFTGILQEEKPLRGWLQEILNNCLGNFTFEFGQLVITLRINSSAEEAFTIGNILYQSAVLEPIEPAFNQLRINFSDEEFGFAGNSVDIYNEPHAILAGGNTGRPQYTKGSLNLAGVTTKDQAGRLASVRLCEELGGINAAQFLAARKVTIQTTALALNVTPGMVCSLTHPDCPDYPAQVTTIDGVTPATPNYIEFRVESWKLNKDFSITIQGKTTNWDTYDVTVGPKPADVAASPVPTIDGTPANWSFRAVSAQTGSLTADQFACQDNWSGVSTAHLDIYYCPEDSQTEMFTPSGFLAGDTSHIDYGTYGTLPVVGEWLECQGEIMLVTAVTISDDYHGFVDLVRGQAGTTAADHARVTSTFTSHNPAWTAEWTVPAGLTTRPGDGLVVHDGFGEEAVVAEYVASTGLLRTTLPLATGTDGDTFQTVPTLRRVIRLQRSIAFTPRFFGSAANRIFAEKIILPYAGVVAIAGTLENLRGLVSAPVYLSARSEQLMTPASGSPDFPYCLRTGGNARLLFTAEMMPTGIIPAAFTTALIAEGQSFERAWLETGNAQGGSGSGPVVAPDLPPDPVPGVPAHGGTITVTHTCSGWEQVTLTIGDFTATWRADFALMTTGSTTAQIATSLAGYFTDQNIGRFYTFTPVSNVVQITDSSGRGGTMTVTNNVVSPYTGATGVLALTTVPLASVLGVLIGRRYAFAFTGGGFRSELSGPTGSTGPTGAASAINLINLPACGDSRVTTREIYGAEDGQGGGGEAAIWHLLGTAAVTATGYTDTATQTTLLAGALYPGSTQPRGSGAILATVTRNGVPWLQLRIPPGSSRSNTIHGLGMFCVPPGTAINVDIVNASALTPALRVVLE